MTPPANTPPSGTLRDLLRQRAAQQPTGLAFSFTDGSRPLTWDRLNIRAHAIAAELTNMGMKKGDGVAVMIPNGRPTIEAFFGILYGGFRATMVNLAAGNDAIAYALNHCDAQFAMIGPDQISTYDAVKPVGQDRITLKGTIETELHDISSDDDALVMYTSGTTGTPKGVVHTHASLLAGGWTTTLAHEITQRDVGYCVLPVCHINGLCVTVVGALVSGSAMVIAPRFSRTAFWADIDAHHVTWFSVVPTIISHLLQGDDGPQKNGKLRFGRSASSALAPDVQRAFENRFGVPIIETMGMTETAAQILSNPLPPGLRKIGSPGLAYGNEIAILRPDFSFADPLEQGEIAIRGPNVMKEYLKNPDATAGTFAPNNWLRSGDLGHKDADGYVYVTGRLKELIIKGGENIAPREIDEALYSHADVVEAAAFARNCQTYGERVEAAVSLAPGSTLSTDDLIAICETRLGRFKSPDMIHVMAELPKGPSGKIQRLKLAEITA